MLYVLSINIMVQGPISIIKETPDQGDPGPEVNEKYQK
jgi:hypothetical protein